MQPAGGDYRGGGGVSLGTPLGAKAAGYFAEDDAGPQRPFAIVVGGGDIATGDRKGRDRRGICGCLGRAFVRPRWWASPRAAGRAGGRGRRGTGRGCWVLEIGATLADADSALQELVEEALERSRCRRCRFRVLRIGRSRWARAQLPFVGMPGLRRVTVSDPDLGLGLRRGNHRAPQHRDCRRSDGRRRSTTTAPHCHQLWPSTRAEGLVRGHHRAGANFRRDRRRAGGQRGFARGRSDWRSPLR